MLKETLEENLKRQDTFPRCRWNTLEKEGEFERSNGETVEDSKTFSKQKQNNIKELLYLLYIYIN